MANSIKEFVQRELANFIIKQGIPAAKEQAEERMKICQGCEFRGLVEPLPTLKMEGCTKCGCPLATKTKMRKIKRELNAKNENLTPQEITRLKMGKAYKMEDIKCPHPDGNKWETIDNKYKNL